MSSTVMNVCLFPLDLSAGFTSLFWCVMTFGSGIAVPYVLFEGVGGDFLIRKFHGRISVKIA